MHPRAHPSFLYYYIWFAPVAHHPCLYVQTRVCLLTKSFCVYNTRGIVGHGKPRIAFRFKISRTFLRKVIISPRFVTNSKLQDLNSTGDCSSKRITRRPAQTNPPHTPSDTLNIILAVESFRAKMHFS